MQRIWKILLINYQPWHPYRDISQGVSPAMPVVLGHNNGEDNIRATAEFILHKLHNRVKQIQLLAYRPLGIEKHHSLSLEYPMAKFLSQDLSVQEKEILNLVSLLQSYGILAVAGANSKY